MATAMGPPLGGRWWGCSDRSSPSPSTPSAFCCPRSESAASVGRRRAAPRSDRGDACRRPAGRVAIHPPRPCPALPVPQLGRGRWSDHGRGSRPDGSPARRISFPAWQYGLAFGVPALGGLVGARLSARLVARYGRHRVMTVSGWLRSVFPLASRSSDRASPTAHGDRRREPGDRLHGVFNPVNATERLRRTPADHAARVLTAWSVSSRLAQAALVAAWGVLATLTIRSRRSPRPASCFSRRHFCCRDEPMCPDAADGRRGVTQPSAGGVPPHPCRGCALRWPRWTSSTDHPPRTRRH